MDDDDVDDYIGDDDDDDDDDDVGDDIGEAHQMQEFSQEDGRTHADMLVAGYDGLGHCLQWIWQLDVMTRDWESKTMSK